MISIIVAHAKNFVIGANGTMPWYLPQDLKHFKNTTMKHPVIMGRKTFISIGRALPGRRNIVVSRNADFKVPEGVEVVSSLTLALNLLKDAQEIFVIGGGMLYKEALPLAQRLYITLIDANIDGDTYFPQYDMDDFKVIAHEDFEHDAKNIYDLKFITLERK